MSFKDLSAKEAYFEEQTLLEISGDEQDFPDHGVKIIEAALADSRPLSPPKFVRQNSGFLGPTPKERHAEFQAHANKQRASVRSNHKRLLRATTAYETDLTNEFTVENRGAILATKDKTDKIRKRKGTASLPNSAENSVIPFYQCMGIVPRELRNGKNTKLAYDIKIELEHRQLFRGKVVYFYPNDDISMARRTRIHKMIQLGAAWVSKWTEDITHIMVDDASTTYGQLLRHFNHAGFPVSF